MMRGPEVNCEVCGQPTVEKFGFCQRTAECRAARQRAYRAENREAIRVRNRVYHRRTRPQRLAAMRDYYARKRGQILAQKAGHDGEKRRMKRRSETKCKICGGRTAARCGICINTPECLKARADSRRCWEGLSPNEYEPEPCAHRNLKVIERYPPAHRNVFQILRCNACAARGVQWYGHTAIDWRPEALNRRPIKDYGSVLAAAE